MLTTRIKACLLFWKDLLPTNLLTSFLIALTGMAYGLPLWKTFFVTFVTGGAYLSSYFYERRRGHQYYFFYNLGIGKGALYAVAFAVDVLFSALVLIIVKSIR